MVGRLIGGGILIGIVSLIVASLPDIARYLKMRQM